MIKNCVTENVCISSFNLKLSFNEQYMDTLYGH